MKSACKNKKTILVFLAASYASWRRRITDDLVSRDLAALKIPELLLAESAPQPPETSFSKAAAVPYKGLIES